MPSKLPFKRHRFPAVIVLCAVRMYLRYPLSYQHVADLLAERDLNADRSTVFRWVQKFGIVTLRGILKAGTWAHDQTPTVWCLFRPLFST